MVRNGGSKSLKASPMLVQAVFVLSVIGAVSAFTMARNPATSRQFVRLWCSEDENLMDDAKFQTFDMSSKKQPDGFQQTDIKKMAEGQKSRVLAYIVLALVPVLFLVPFFLSRDFEPANF